MPEKMPTVGQLVWWALNGLIGISVTVCAWFLSETSTTIKKIDERVAAVELWKAEVSGNRFTAKDGAEVWKTIADAKTAIATVQTTQVRMASDLGKLDEVGRIVARIEARVDAIEKMLSRHLDGNKVSALDTDDDLFGG